MMKTMCKAMMTSFAVMLLLGHNSFANDQEATPEEVYQLILKGMEVVEQLGDEGLAAFNDPKGDFVYKDTYIWVVDCSNIATGHSKILAHPNNKMIGYTAVNRTGKHPDPSKRRMLDVEICEVAKKSGGGWTEYYWEKLGEEQPVRKISFSIMAPNANYALSAGIYNDDMSLEELNGSIK